MKLVIISICLNEGKTIKEVLDRMPKKIEGVDDIVKLVVDDGSTDDTAKIARENGAIVFSNNSQKRLAYSFQFAINKALELGADIAVNIDGDLQFRPEEISQLVKPILDDKADFVVGNRFIDPKTGNSVIPKNMKKSKYYGNKIGAKVINIMSKTEFSDVTCGFRAYNREALLHLNINGKYTYTQESFQLLATKKLDIVQVPISIKYFKGRKSRVVSSIFSFVFTSGLNIVRVFRDFAPLKFFGILGLFPFVLGTSLIIFMMVHWLRTGDFSPYKAVGFAGIYFFTLGIFIFVIGFLSDILGRIINNQEKSVYFQKKIYYSKFEEEK